MPLGGARPVLGGRGVAELARALGPSQARCGQAAGQVILDLGGRRRRMPATTWAALTLSLSGLPLAMLASATRAALARATLAPAVVDCLVRGRVPSAGPAAATGPSAGAASSPSATIGSCCTSTWRLNRLPTDSSLIPSIMALNMS